MAVAAQVVNGKVVANYTTDTNERKTGNDSLDKDAFLQILVAEMQYQDPLEPSSNTEWVTQMSSFTQVEELQSLGDSIKEQGAADLVGKRVILAETDSSSGSTTYVTGVVQCIEKLSDGVYLSIDDNLYNVDKLYSVVDEAYYEQLMQEADKKNAGTQTE